jgi:hypothetical protein
VRGIRRFDHEPVDIEDLRPPEVSMLQHTLAPRILRLDAALRKRHGVFEFSTDRSCIFRIAVECLTRDLELSGGARVEAGRRVLDLHLWNERLPPDPTLAWGRRISRLIDHSLGLVADFLAARPDLADIAGLRARMTLGSTETTNLLVKLSERFGFEPVVGERLAALDRAHRAGENMLILMLLFAHRNGSVEIGTLWRGQVTTFLPRPTLEMRYPRPGVG